MAAGTLHLASASPRRRELLAALGYEFTHGPVDIDESELPGEAPADMVLRLAAAKARTAFETGLTGGPVLGADTAVVVGQTVFGKPVSKRDALHMLAQLSGRRHRVLTGVAVLVDGVIDSALSETEVQFREIRPDEAEAYWHSGEPAGKAGAYAVQGLAGIFVSSINGSYTGVVGLPVYETAELLRRAGIVPRGMPAHE
ncbi:MAG: Maf family protein [Woeseiaceae bacterium]|nr:Maf family protein [Woeseiaceae bacterium]